MKVSVKLNPINQMLSDRGLQKNGRVQRLFASECARYMDKYVPMNSGIMKNTKIIGADSVTYNVPYGKFTYYGKVMVNDKGSTYAKKGERKHVIDRELTYRGAPQRGKQWDKKMWINHKHQLLKVIANAAGGRVK